eukprot:6731226-Prymnesium_polylepis.1
MALQNNRGEAESRAERARIDRPLPNKARAARREVAIECVGGALTRRGEAAHLAVAAHLGLGRLAAEAHRLGTEHIGAAGAARPVARAHVGIATSGPAVQHVAGLDAGLGRAAAEARQLGGEHIRAAATARPVTSAHVSPPAAAAAVVVADGHRTSAEVAAG